MTHADDAGFWTDDTATDYMAFLPWLARSLDVSNYLEIGVNQGQLLSNMIVETAIGVDPNYVLNSNVAANKKRVFLYQNTSDKFFQEEKDLLHRFQPHLSFLDGMHLFEYLLRDFINTEAASARSSLIVMHDCMPKSVGMCTRRQEDAYVATEGSPFHGMWTGDVWKIIPILAQYRPDLTISLVDAKPTGLVCISNLDPESAVLRQHYLDIVRQFYGVADDAQNIRAALDRPFVSTSEMMSRQSASAFFRNRI